MQRHNSIFALFGGIRPMAATLGENPSTVYSWRSVDRIPAEKQPRVLETGLALGLPITPELVVYPSGNVPEAVITAARAHRPRIALRTVTGATDKPGVGGSADRKYGNRAPVLDTCARTVAA